MDTMKEDIKEDIKIEENNTNNGKINDGEVVNLLKDSLNRFIDDEKENEKDIQKNLAEDENEDLQLKNTSLDKRTKVVVSLINNFYNVIHLLIAFFLAHFFGSNGWHISWIILLILVMLRLHNLYTSELYKQKYLRYQQKMSKKNEKIGPMKEEKTEWLNDFLKCYYPNIVNSHMVMEMARSWLHDFVGGQMELYKPPMVKSAEVSSFEFGETPPEINYIRAYKKENPNEYEMDIDILYRGEMKVDMKIYSKLGTVPVSIHNFKINCQMKIEIGFWEKFPYLRYMRLAFRHLRKDWISFDLKALVEIFNIEFIRNWINSAIDYGIKCSMHLPHKLELRWDTNTDQDFKDLKEGEFDHNGKYTTAVTLNIVQAKNLKVPDSNIPIDAYCKVQAGKFFVTTQTVKNLHPSWREQLIIPIDNRIPIDDQALEISIWDKGKKDTQHGSLKIPIKKLSPNTSVQGWFRVNGFSHQAEIHCILEYDINYTHNQN